MKNPYSIAVVGLGGVFPSAPDVSTFWENIISGHDASQAVTSERWPDQPEWFASRQGHDSVASVQACLLERIPEPKCAGTEDLDDLSKLALAAAEMAIEDSQSELLDRSRVATILASIALPTTESSRLSEEFFAAQVGASLEPRLEVPSPQAKPHWRAVTGQPAQTVAHFLGLGGYTLTLDAACASSLYAVKLACDALSEGQVDAVLAGGANRADSLYTQAGFTALGACSKSGKCSPFDAKGDGLVVGEGAGFLLLKRLDDALQQGDRIHAVIRGVGLSNDVGGSLLAPDSEGQLRALKQAYEQAGWSAEDVDLVECHGTGTPMGDRTEFNSLKSFWPKRDTRTVLGSVKSQIGHLLTGAAAAALIKVILSIRHRTLPPMNNFQNPAKGIELEGGPFRILGQPEPWQSKQPLRAGVSAFGFGGINGHVLLEEYHQGGPRLNQCPEPQEVVVTGVAVKMGQEHDLDRLLEDVLKSQTAATGRPESRWPGAENLPGNLEQIQGAFLSELEVEAGEFRVPPRDLPEILLQQSLLLAVAGEATRQSSLGDRERCRRSGALIGISLDMETTNYHLRWSLRRVLERLNAGVSEEAESKLRESLSRALDSTRTLGALGSVAASRAAREFSLGGPSYAISCGELSGIRAFEIGARAIKNQEMDSCLIGAIDLAGDPRSVWAQDQIAPFTRAHQAHPFDKRGEGPTIAEGAVALVLKSRQAALADGDRILAVVEGIHSSGGKDSLARVLQALSGSGRGPLGYLEVLSKGVASTDQRFLEQWAQHFPERSPEQARPTALGTSVGSVGYAGAAAGLLSVARSVTALATQIIPGLPGLQQPLETAEGMYLPKDPAYWWHDHQDGPRRCAAVGEASGGDAFALEFSSQTSPSGLKPTLRARALPAQLFLVPTASLQEFTELAKGSEDIVDLAFLWQARELPSEGARGAIVARDKSELLQALELLRERAGEAGSVLDGPAGVFYRESSVEGETAWLFPGSGNHYLGMGREFALLFPEVAAEVCSEAQQSFQHFTPWLSQPFDPSLSESEALAAIEAHPLAPIFGQVTFAVLAARVLAQFLPQPQAAIGYSLGESAALFAMGAWKERDRMYQRTVVSPLFREQLRMSYTVPRSVLGLGAQDNFEWRVAVLNRPEGEVRRGIESLSRDDLFLLIVNTPKECVVGGQAEAVALLTDHLGCEAFTLDGVPVVHCPLMHPVAKPYDELHRLKTEPPDQMRFYNGHRHQSYIPNSESAAASITENAQFGFSYPKLVEAAYADGVRNFLEIGPGGSCARMVREILENRPHWTRSLSLPREGSESFSLLRLLAGAYVNGLEVDLGVLYPAPEATTVTKVRPRVTVAAGATLPQPLSPGVPWQRTPKAPPAPLETAPVGGAKTAPPRPRTVPPARSPRVPTRAKARRALVWAQPAKIHPKTLTKDGKVMTPQPGNGQHLEPVIGLHPDYAGDSAAHLAASIVESTRQTALAHESYLALMENTRLQMEQLLGGAVGGFVAPPSSPRQELEPWTKLDPGSPNPVMRGERPARSGLAFDRDMCMEFAIGSIAKVLGPKFARVDSHNVRVRLPDEPLMLCDRILELEGEAGSLGSGRLTTEHDVFPEAWYLDHDRAPVCISVEAGQADLFLCSYLGIDLATGGDRAYRLLDATVSFHRGLPQPGETILYDIRINRFVQQGEVYLFFFEFDGTIDGQPLITMRNGCAGFHTYEEIEASGGIVLTREQQQPKPGVAPAGWAPLAPFPQGLGVTESYSDVQVQAFRDRDLVGCFGSGFGNLGLHRPYGLPTGRMKLFDRVLALQPNGGRFGLGRIEAEADIHPDDWFLTCHFKDDMVMPGTLMYECCAHSLRFLLARLGWVSEETEVAFEPKLNTPAALKCRGPVLVTTKKVLYCVDIKEIGYGPEPYVIADALMYGDGKAIVRFEDMSMRLTGLSQSRLESIWGASSSPASAPQYLQTPAIYDKQSIMEFSNGRPSLAFGPEYEVFDSQRRIARLPGPPYQFMDRVTEVNPPKFVLKAGDWIEAHYDVPPDEWYFAANRQDSMSYAILLEAALQPCGWLAAYCGSALRSDSDMKFRNLGGTATLYKELFPEIGTIRMRVRMTDVSEAGGMIIENFDMEVYSGQEMIYQGTTYFGFFSAAALANQVGVRDAEKRTYVPTDQEWSQAQSIPLPVLHPLSPDDRQVEPQQTAAMPAKALLMMDQVDIFLPQGGAQGLGFIQGSKIVDPDEWFFKAHFYQDPVWPGSLGLEAFLQLIKYAALQYWPECADTHRFEPIAIGLEHTWAYRGQVIPKNKKVIVDLSITTKEGGESPLLLGQGFLRVDGIPIYEMTDFGLRMVKV